mmetsp:Transcript_130019/g.259372  ORF Transcript_130019/g.259372 Transcript_130019/m.259372 type:complete len:868 (+) Transcript_130019:90-2693(+)
MAGALLAKAAPQVPSKFQDKEQLLKKSKFRETELISRDGRSPEVAPRELKSGKQHGAYRPDVDGLRAVAVLAVFAYHMDTRWLPGGFVGVDIFFVISGYVVAGSLLSHQEPDVKAFFINFYSRRMKRLTPALVLVTVLAGLATAVIVPPWTPDIEDYYKAGMFGLIGWSNNHFAYRESAEKSGYFEAIRPDAPRNPFIHLWSLGVEEQFYFTFPAILLVAHGQKVAKSFSWTPRWPTSSLIFGGTIILSLLISIPMTIWREKFAFYTLPPRYWELSVGALIFDLEAYFASKQTTRNWSFKEIVGLQAATVLCIVLALLFTPEGAGFPFPWALLPVIGAACFIVAGSESTSHINWLLARKLPVYIGKLSYPIYLWHWPVIVLSDLVFENIGWGSESALNVVGFRLCQLLIVAAGATATYHLVEGSFRNWKPSTPWKVVFVLGPCILAAEVWLGLLGGPLNGSMFPVQETVWVDNSNAGAPTDNDADPEADPELGNASQYAVLVPVANLTDDEPANLTNDELANLTDDEPDLGGMRGPGGTNTSTTTTTTTSTLCAHCRCCLQDRTFHTPPGAKRCEVRSRPPCFAQKQNYNSHWQHWGDWVNHCWGWDYIHNRYKTTPIEACLTPNRGPDGKKPAMFLFGDSHAQASVPALRHAVTRDYSFVYATKPRHNCFKKNSSYCQRVGDHIKKLLKPGDVVAMAYASWKFSPALIRPGGFRGSLEQMHQYMEFIHLWSNTTKKHGASVLILGDPTVMKDRGLFCIPSSFNPHAGARCARSRKWGTNYGRKFRANLRELVSRVVSNAYFFDPRDLFCDHSMCSAMIPGTSTLAIGDQEHLTIEGSVYMWPFLCSFLSKRGLLPYRAPSDDKLLS